MVFTQGQPATVSEHQFNSMESCLLAKEQATSGSFRFSREVKAFCVEK
jgi:hypothetical protein